MQQLTAVVKNRLRDALVDQRALTAAQQRL
jgi:hypothetical protein